MTSEMRTQFKRRAKIVKALAHPTRLFIVDHLARHRNCVQELTKMVGVDISTVSKHLAILKKAGILTDEKSGLQVCYRLRMPCVKDFLACMDHMSTAGKRCGGKPKCSNKK